MTTFRAGEQLFFVRPEGRIIEVQVVACAHERVVLVSRPYDSFRSLRWPAALHRLFRTRAEAEHALALEALQL